MNEKLPILIAEDDENDVLMLQRALRKAGFTNPFHICPNGADAIVYLKGEPPYEDREKFRFPRLVITDLKMPQMDGFELLTWLQNHPDCNMIPKLVLSASRQQEDVKRAYRLGANSYLVKPSSFEDLVGNLRLCLEYWSICEKPDPPARC
jgi:CheY-like chemotaxis protein